MNFFLTRFLALGAGGLTLAFSLPAADTIQFSKPVDPELVNRANSFVPAASERRSVVGGVSAPSEVFSSPPDDFPLPAPVMMIPQTDSMKEALNRRANWTLMTPEEILGVPTAEKMLGLPDQKDEDKLSPEERFLFRLQRERSTANSALSALRQQDATSLRNSDSSNPFARREDRNSLEKTATDAQPGSPKYFNQLLNGTPNAPPDAGAFKAVSPWATAFTQPNQLPPSAEQQAGMERFRAMMEPSSPPESPAVTRFSPVPVPVPDPNMQPQPYFNPAGRSYQPVQQNISRPQGITPLPSITGPYTTPKQPTAQAQLPPWLQDSPQTFSLPVRKF